MAFGLGLFGSFGSVSDLEFYVSRCLGQLLRWEVRLFGPDFDSPKEACQAAQEAEANRAQGADGHPTAE